jgi:hypothetical protein
MNYKREQERVKIWKIKQKAKRKRFREWCNITTIAILQLVVVALIIVFYGVFALFVMSDVKADTVKVGDGAFVMAVSYTESYDDLQYVANFPDCDLALDYYNQNCTSAYIMACQLEEYLYLPMNHNVRNEFSSFDFEIDTKQSCGFVGVQKLPKFTGVK